MCSFPSNRLGSSPLLVAQALEITDNLKGYAKHGPTRVNATSLHNISYATYANIRFAQPPVGDLRFRAPQVPPPFNATVQNGIYPRNATDCVNSVTPGLAIAPGVDGVTWGSEDCLFLNVKVPEGVQGGKVPVLHWLYGGGVSIHDFGPRFGQGSALLIDWTYSTLLEAKTGQEILQLCSRQSRLTRSSSR